MRAELRGFGFEITPSGSTEQLVDADMDTTWGWEVRPVDAGMQRLTVTLTAILNLEGSDGMRDVATFHRDVQVEAIPKAWWQRSLDAVREYGPSRDVIWPAVGTALAALWAFLLARRRKRRRG